MSASGLSTLSKTAPILRLGLLSYIVITASTCYVFILRGLDYAPPLAFAGFRTLIGGTVLLMISAFGSGRILPERRLWKWVPLVALTATSLTFGSMFLSPKFAGAGIASIIGNTQPLFIAAIGFFFLRERLSGPRALALIFGLLGVVVIVSPSIGRVDNSLLVGSAIALVTSLSAAVGTILGRYIKLGDSIIAFVGTQLALGGTVLLGASFLFEETSIQWTSAFVGIILFLAILNTALVTWSWFYLLQREEASSLGMYLFLVPVLGVLWAYLFVGERPESTSFIGGVLVLLAVFTQEFEGFIRRFRLRE